MPRRQLIVCHLAGQRGLGGNRRLVGDVVLAALAGFGDGEDQGDLGGIDVLASRQPHGPEQAAFAQRLTEWPTGAVTGIGQHAAETRAGGDHAIDLLDRDLRLCQSDLPILGNTRLGHPLGIRRPGLGQEKAQADHHRHFARCQGHRDQRLAVGRLAKRGGVLRGDPDRMLPFLWQRGVVDDEEAALVPQPDDQPPSAGPPRAGRCPRRSPQRNGEADRIRPHQTGPPSAARSCGPPGRSGQQYRGGTCADAPDAKARPEKAKPIVRDRLASLPQSPSPPPAPSIMARESATIPPGSTQSANLAEVSTVVGDPIGFGN